MLKTSENGSRAHATGAPPRSEDWRCHSQRSMWAFVVVVGRELGQESVQVPLVEHNDVVQSLLPKGPAKPLRHRICPRRSDRCPHAGEADPGQLALELLAVDRIAVMDEVPRGAPQGVALIS